MNLVFFPPRLLSRLGANAAARTAAESLHTESSAAAIRFAEVLGARRLPAAALHVRIARAEMNAAEELKRAGANDEAYSLLLRAGAEADLAIRLCLQDSQQVSSQLTRPTHKARATHRVYVAAVPARAAARG